MTNYSFHSLSDADFEDLAADLLGAELKVSFQRFTRGRDGGIDGLAGSRIAGSDVIQCKHFWKSGYNKLYSRIEKSELPKITHIQPERYILATSLGLTPQNKESLLNLLSPYCRGIDDIYGCQDLNRLLGEHPSVERRHYKLWLTSTAVLQSILRQGSLVWNAMTEDAIKDSLSRYVQSAAYDRAMQTLQRFGFCVLAGIPGVGKTTLARILVTRLMEDGHELIAVRSDVQQALDSLDVTKRQVVYYDDFLGSTSLGGRLEKNEDVGLIQLLKLSRKTSCLKIVLATREYILEDAKRLHEPLARYDLDIAKCTVRIADYTKRLRARMLYNHLYFSPVTRDQIEISPVAQFCQENH